MAEGIRRNDQDIIIRDAEGDAGGAEVRAQTGDIDAFAAMLGVRMCRRHILFILRQYADKAPVTLCLY